MPWKSDKQRRWAHATGQPWAKDWDNKYAEGGETMKGLLTNTDVNMTIKDDQGATVSFKAPKGVSMDGLLGGMINGTTASPVSDHKMIKVTPGEYVVNYPATQKYKPLLEQINNEGKQMLAQGGYVKGYAMGGETGPADVYNMLQEDFDHLVSMIQQGASLVEVANYYIDMWQLPATDSTYAGIERAFMDAGGNPNAMREADAYANGGMVSQQPGFIVEDPRYAGGYFHATGEDPTGMTADPSMPAQNMPNFAQLGETLVNRAGIQKSPRNYQFAEEFAKKAWDDWSGLPSYEQEEWGGFDEFLFYHAQAFNRGEEYALGGQVPSEQEKLNRIRRWLDQMNLNKREEAILLKRLGIGEGYWTGGEVGKGNPEEGDTPPSIPGLQGIVFSNGQWVYKKSGNPIPAWAINKIAAATSSVASETEEPGGELSNNSSIVAIDKSDHAKNYSWGKRSIEAEGVIRELIAKGFNPASLEYAKGEQFAKIFGDLARTEDGQRYKKAVESLVAAVLRKDTGAAIAQDEFERTYRQLFGSLGTGEAAQTDASNQRIQNIEGFIASAGPGAAELIDQFNAIGGADAPSGASGSSIISGEDIGATIGSIGGAAIGTFTAPFTGGVANPYTVGATGGFIGGNIGEYFDTGEVDLDINDAINTVLGAAAGVGQLGKSIFQGAKALMVSRGWIGKEGAAKAVQEVAEQVGKKGIKGAATSAAGKVASQVTGRASAEVVEQAAAAGLKTSVNYGGKPFFVNLNTGQVMDGITGSIVKGRLAKDVIKQAGPPAANFAMGGQVKGLLG